MMKLDDRLQQLAYRTPGIMGMREARASAVCVPLIRAAEGYEVLFEVRSSKIDVQPGDICFPGGMMEPGEMPEQTAVRECMEELLVRASQIHVIAPMDILFNGMITIYPYLIHLEEYQESYSEAEVGEVFTVPLDYFLQTEPEVYTVPSQPMPGEDFPFERIVGGKAYHWRNRQEQILFYQYHNKTIWGLTAKVMKSVVDLIKDI